MFKFLFNLRTLTSTAFVFVSMWLLSSIGVQFELFNVFEHVISDFNITDMYYTKFRQPADEPFEDEMILVNIGNLDRRGIATQINILNQYEPKVIAIDARFFSEKSDPVANFMLSNAIKNTENFVLGSELAMMSNGDASTNVWDTLLLPIKQFNEHAHTGFVNIGDYEGPTDFATWRDIYPKDTIKGGITESCFAAKIAELYDPERGKAFFDRNNKIEDIYFKGNLEKYIKLDVQDVFNLPKDSITSPQLIKGKIVLMGYMGSGYTDYHFDADRFYTPLNEKYMGRGFPDMYGVVVHANIISMILDKNYINVMPEWLSTLIGILTCLVNAAIFSYILKRANLAPFFGLTKVFQLVQVIALLGITLYLYSSFRYKVDFTLAFLVIILSGDVVEIYLDVILVSIKRLISYLIYLKSAIKR